jgi:hypothetical protein
LNTNYIYFKAYHYSYNWGSWGYYIFQSLSSVAFLGFQFVPYDVFPYIAIVLLIFYLLSLVFIFFAYQTLKKGSDYWKKLKLFTRIVSIFASIFATVSLFSLTVFWRCDYDNVIKSENGDTEYALVSI